MEDVCGFLDGLSLQALTTNFKSNAVNGKDLLELSDEDMMHDLSCTRLQVSFSFILFVVCPSTGAYISTISKKN